MDTGGFKCGARWGGCAVLGKTFYMLDWGHNLLHLLLSI